MSKIHAKSKMYKFSKLRKKMQWKNQSFIQNFAFEIIHEPNFGFKCIWGISLSYKNIYKYLNKGVSMAFTIEHFVRSLMVVKIRSNLLLLA